MSDFAAFLFAVLIVLTSSVAMSSWLDDARPAWSASRVIVVSAAPFPVILALPCLLVFWNAMTSSREECGVDACGMAATFAVFGMMAAIALFLLGVAAAALNLRWRA